MNENYLQYEGYPIQNDYKRNFQLIEEIISKKDSTIHPNSSSIQYPTHHNGIHHPLINQKKKDKGGKYRDRFVGTINQSSYLNSIALNTQKQTISKHKNQLKSQKLQQQNNFHLSNNPNHINNNNNFYSPTNPRLIRQRFQHISLASNTNLNRDYPSSSSNLSPLAQFSSALSLTNLSIAPYTSQSSSNLQNPAHISNRNFRINPISLQKTTNPYSSQAIDQEEQYQKDEIIESKEIQEELQDEQTCKYIQLLKRGFEESPLSNGSPYLNGGTETNQKRKILNFFNKEISDDMKNVFSLHSLTNINDKNSTMGSMNNFLLSTINDANELAMHENTCSANNINTKHTVNGKFSSNQVLPPAIIDTIELRPNMIEDDFYQNILDWCKSKRVAAIADSTKIHLTDFKTQKNDAVLSSQMEACNIDYLPHFQQLLAQPIANNFNSIQSWSINSSTHFLSSQKKKNHQKQPTRFFDIHQVFSSTSLQATSGMGFQSMNFLHQNQQDTESPEEGGENIGQIINEESKASENNQSKFDNKNDEIIDEIGATAPDEEDDNVCISIFNLNTPSPKNLESKQQEFNQLNYSGIFSIPPQLNSPILPQNSAYYSVLKFSPSGHILVAGRSDGIIEIYDIERKVSIYTVRCHQKLITAISINQTYIATASKDSKVVIFDIRDINRIYPSALLSSRNSSSILALEWNPLSENTLAASTESGYINLYNILKDDKCAYKEFQLKESSIKTIAWNPFKRGVLLAGSLDGFIFLIDLERKQLLQRKKILNHIYKIIFSPNQSDRFVCLTGNQPEINQQNRQSQQNQTTNQDIISDDFGLQTGNMFVLSYPQINKFHQVSVGQKRVCQGILSHDGSTILTLSKDNYLRQWKVFREPLTETTNQSILTSAQDLR